MSNTHKSLRDCIKSFLPRPLRVTIRYCLKAVDTICSFFVERTNPLIPPRTLRVRVGPAYKSALCHKRAGKLFFFFLKNNCALKPSERILDIGCGCGQVAVPLTRYLNQRGAYEGFDVDRELIEWCRANISTRYPHFHFQLADVFSRAYNPTGAHQASQYIFPFKDESFDLVFLRSVFTHMVPPDMENYFSEISRVLKERGRCIITYYLYKKQSPEEVNTRFAPLQFQYVYDKYCTVNKDTPEDLIAYSEEYIRGLYERFHLSIQSITPGYQDVFFAIKYQDVICAIK